MGLYTTLPGDVKEVDVIIAGGGTAGCVITGRLAEADPNLSILVIEGGPNNDSPTVSIPLLFFSHISPGSKTTVFYKTNKEHGVGDRELLVATSSVLGGGSSTNMMMYSRPQRSDWDSWKTPGWSSNEMLPYLKKLENYHGPGQKELHGYDGPMQINRGTFWSPRFQDDFIAAATQLGYPEAEDLHTLDANNGVARPMRYMLPNGKRSDAASSYVHPKLQDGKHPNLHVLLASRVVRVLFEGKRAVGVEFLPNKEVQPDDTTQTAQSVRARRMVVVSCGALGTPAVLERSGLGSPEILGKAGIPLVADLPGIGEDYEDHHLVLYGYRSGLNPDETFDAIVGGRVDVEQLIKDNDKMMGWNGQDVGYRFRPTEEEVASMGPDFQNAWNQHYRDFPDKPIVMGAALPGFPLDPNSVPVGQYMSLSAFTTYPMSRGHVHITGSDVTAPVDLATGYFADAGGIDIKKHMWAYKKQREIFRRMRLYRGEVAHMHPPFPPESQAACKELDGPLTDVEDLVYSPEDDATLEKWLRENVGTTWHSLGTCKMAPLDKKGVVNARLDVHGIEGLKLADMSVVPQNAGSNTASIALAIGEKAADIIADELGISKN